MTRRLSFGLAAALVSGCHAQTELKASADKDVREESTFSVDGPGTAPSGATATPTTPPKTTTQTVAAPVAPPPEACPMVCYAASGAAVSPVTAAESATIRTSLEPVMAGMRSCTNADQWRRQGSPVLNLRVGSDGLVNEVDVDPHHGFDSERSCLDTASHQAVTLSLPGRYDVRCAEKCEKAKTDTPLSDARAHRGR